ncbi:MAG TPA: ferritin-like domain-containing protein [Chitinophagaceae bacterium]|nr:ferritin-like domain-containing protein [Chitinophagaceae bacterium]
MDPQKAVAQNGPDTSMPSRIDRRRFLLFGGTLAASAALVTLSSCDRNNDDDGTGVNLGSGDTGILNYAYALEQLEAAFYTQVVATPFSGITAMESAYMADIRDHEIAHREFFKAALGDNAIPALEVNFSGINFTSRDSVLATAKAFEDLGVAAYNGAGKLLESAAFLTLAGKIVSVEARHAALIRDLIANGTFADNSVVDMKGLDVAMDPAEVLATASPFLKTKINASNLPTS